jgi:hypothetical protein
MHTNIKEKGFFLYCLLFPFSFFSINQFSTPLSLYNMAFVTFVRANPALAPLFLFAGAGCAAAVT